MAQKLVLNCIVDSNPNPFFKWPFANSIMQEILKFTGDELSLNGRIKNIGEFMNVGQKKNWENVKKSFEVDVMPKINTTDF